MLLKINKYAFKLQDCQILKLKPLISYCVNKSLVLLSFLLVLQEKVMF